MSRDLLGTVAPRNPALTRTEASAYCGVSVRHFERHIAPYLPAVDLKGAAGMKSHWRYRLADLDAFLDARSTGAIATRGHAA